MSANTNAKKAAEAREAGNAAYKKGKWVDAIGHYTTASVLAPQDPAPLLNRAQAYLRIEKWQDCERDCTKVLGLTGHNRNVKALYRRALARKERKLFDEAQNDLEVLLKAEPTNAAAKEELIELKKTIKSISGAPTSKKVLQDISTFAELTSKRTSSKTTDIPARNRSQAVKVPIKVVPRFTTTPPSTHTISDPASRLTANARSEAVSAAVPPPDVPAKSSSAFALHKASRSAKSSFVRPVEVDSKPDVPSKPISESRPEIQAPQTGLELVDRLQDLAEQDEQRWQLLQTVNPQRLTTLLGGILEPDHLALIYDTLARHQQRSKGSTQEIEKIKLYMQALRRIPRWQMTETLLLPNERKMGEVWNSCNK